MEKINSLPSEKINIEDALSEAAKLRGDGDYPGAEKLFSSVVALRERTLGLENETTQASLNQLAFVLLRQEKFAEAEKIYTELLKLRGAKYGNMDRGSTGYRFNLLSIYKAQSRWAEAEKMGRALLPIFTTYFGADSPKSLGCLRALAEVLLHQGKTEEGTLLVEDGLKITAGINSDDKQEEEKEMRELYERMQVKLEI